MKNNPKVISKENLAKEKSQKVFLYFRMLHIMFKMFLPQIRCANNGAARTNGCDFGVGEQG